MRERRKVLMACHLDWGAPMRVGSHHIARGFVQAGWDVGYVSNALSPLQALRDRQEFARRRATYRRNGSRDLGGHLWTTFPLAALTPHNVPVARSRWVHENWQRTTLPSIVRQVRDAGFGSVDLLYVESPGQAFWLEAIDFEASAARVMDRMKGFTGFPSEMRRLETQVIRSVDLVAYSAMDLAPDLESAGARRTLHLPNGVQFDHFAGPAGPCPADLAGIAHPRVVYAGAIDTWFDFDAVNSVAAELPDVSFVFIGPDRLARERLRSVPNVHLLGWKPFDALPGYLHHADLGWIPFDVQGHPDLVHAIHPLKLYEYLAAGIPVVATRWDELSGLGSPAVLVDDPMQLADALRSTLRQPPDPAIGTEFARRADWRARVTDLLTALEGDS